MSDADSFNNDEYTYQNNINPVEMNGEAENEETEDFNGSSGDSDCCELHVYDKFKYIW